VVTPSKIDLHKFCSIDLKNGEAFIQYCETAPEARGKNVFTDVLKKISEDLKDKRLLTAVFSNNKASLKSFAKAGFVEVERYRIFIFFGVKKITKTQAA
jgi:RimJ/RimL family protein N-acetyltransferase